MIISTRGRYAIRILIELAEHGDEFVPLKQLAANQEISPKYLEHILPLLRKRGIVLAIQGKGGGYKLARKPADYTIAEILEITETDFAPVSCLEHYAPPCPRADRCKTLPMWKAFATLTKKFFMGITLEDLMCNKFDTTML